MKEQKYHIYLSGGKRSFMIQNLVWFQEKLRREGNHTDAVDDLILKFAKAKLKTIKVK